MRAFLKALTAIVVVAVVAGASFLAGFEVNQLLRPTETIQPKAGESEYFDLFWEAWQVIEQEFFGELPDPEEFTYGAIRGALETLDDPATMLLEPMVSEDQMIDLRGAYEGIGALVSVDDEDQIIIVSPFDGSPAMEAGIRAGDIVLKVDDVAVTGMPLEEAVRLIRGPRGTTVRLTIMREETAPLEIEVIRDEVEPPTVGAVVLEDDIGYVRIALFSERTSRQLKETLQELMEENLSGLILDLRNNPGGVFPSAAIEVASQFVGEGAIVYEQFSDGREQAHRALRGGLATDIPLVVLVNQGTASNSEVVAGAIQDYDRGVLIGEQTFGKGSVQRVHELSDGSTLHVTTALLFTPNHHPIHEEGLTPDIVVPFTEEDFLQGVDHQLERAIEYIKTGR